MIQHAKINRKERIKFFHFRFYFWVQSSELSCEIKFENLNANKID